MKINHNINNMQNWSAWYYHVCLSLGNIFSRIISVLYGSGLELKGGHSCKITNVNCRRKGEVSTLESSWSQIQWQTDTRGRPQLPALPAPGPAERQVLYCSFLRGGSFHRTLHKSSRYVPIFVARHTPLAFSCMLLPTHSLSC